MGPIDTFTSLLRILFTELLSYFRLFRNFIENPLTHYFHSMADSTLKEKFSNWIHDLQDRICDKLESIDGDRTFQEDQWKREEGGGGRSRVMEKGSVFEKAGVNISIVDGVLPDPIKERFEVDHGWFFAGGLSLVIHPFNPMVPTVHANYRYFELYEKEGGPRKDAWFGGGADLTPYYLWEEDARHFHQTHKDACDPHGKELYPEFKKQCDDYFYNAHRGEARGIGGIFFDYRRADEKRGLEDWFNFVTSCGEAFLPSYTPIVERRKFEPYNEYQRYFQEQRRGRYVEFNLIHDRGTLFGLKTGGRTESILMSLPPVVRWDYNAHPVPGTPEAELVEILKNPKDWV